MSMEMNSPFRPVNNDRMAAVTAFRAAPVASAPAEGATAVALQGIPAPRPTHLNDNQASGILGALQQENQQDLLQVHSGLDADRVARLLSLLD